MLLSSSPKAEVVAIKKDSNTVESNNSTAEVEAEVLSGRTVLGYPERIIPPQPVTACGCNGEPAATRIQLATGSHKRYPRNDSLLADGRERFRARVQDNCPACHRPLEADPVEVQVREQVLDRIAFDLLKKAIRDCRTLTGCLDEEEIKL